jgi:predicted ATPase/signal transduction histidine kinase
MEVTRRNRGFMTTSSFNFQLSGYRIIEELYRDIKTVVYRAECTDDRLGQDSRAVAIKVLATAYPTDRDLLEFRHQYTIAKKLDLPGVVRHYSLEESDRGYALVMEDFGGISLDQYVQQQQLDLVDLLNLAIQLADILHAIGQQQVVHKDLKPANILIHPVTKQVKLIDFSVASLLPRENQEIIDPNQLEGTLAYLSPEQTGRMNRGIDYRTDFYAVGVTLYELLTGKLPFATQDSLELIYRHLAQIATPVHLIQVDIPVAVSQIVAKLMAKNVEDRYQTALGIKYDLVQCLTQYQATGTVGEFRLADRDLSDRFLIPERLYGRESEVKVLLDAFDRVSAGASELLLLAGHSGIGKTAVINEVHKPIVKQRGYFIKGKFDQFNRSIPFSGFVQAFRDLIRQLLSESDLQLADWHSQILAAVGENGQVLIEVIPELIKIIGTQPPVAELSGKAAQQRFNSSFQRLIEVFTTAAHPLVIFLDDLQWADSVSLEAIELLMRGTGYLLLLGAYRDNEVSPAHPLMLMLEKIQQADVVMSKITLAPLTFSDTNRLVADTLQCEINRAKSLTESIDLKAQGNPLFITQFLKALHADGEIWFNPDGSWECDINKIQSLAITDDVVEFIAIQIQKLPMATQHVLKLAACIGARFDLDVLSIVSEQSELVTTAVWNGLYAGLISPTSQIYKFNSPTATLREQDLRDLPDGVDGVSRVFQLPAANSTYRFLHDRVQQAAYSLIPADQKQQTHLQIGRLLLANTSIQQQSDKLFEIVNHLNIAILLIQQIAERQNLAELNLLAAEKARASNAYAAAYEYARIGIELLGQAGWQQQYYLTLALYETLADAAFLCGEFAVIPKLFQTVLDRSKIPLDRVKIYETIIRFHAIQKQYPQAISRGLEILQQLGVELSPQPDQLVLLKELALTKIALWGKSNNRLLNLPETVAPKKIAPMRILDLLQVPAFFCSQELMALLSLVGIRLTLRDGNTPWSATFYAVYCIINAGLSELKQAYRFSQLAMMLTDRFVDLSVKTRVQLIAAWYANPSHEQLRTTIPLLDASVATAIESSNLQYIGINAGVSIATRFFAGIPLAEIVDLTPKIIELVTQSNHENSQEFFDLIKQTIFNLYVPSTQPTEILKGQDKLSLIARWQANNESLILSNMYSFQTLLAYHFEDMPNALIYADAQLPYEYAATGGYTISQIWMFDALTRLAAYPHSDQRVKKQLLDRVKYTQCQLGKRARSMPANFQHQYDLVAAEKCRVLGDFATAIERYDQAISGAKTHKFLHEEALANELAAKFYLAWGKLQIAAVYMQSAYYGYQRWNAAAKTVQLAQLYPQLLAPILQAQLVDLNPLLTLAKVTNPSQDHPNLQGLSFDLASVIQSAQALSSTIELTELIKQLSRIILQNSGAETCILALPDLQDKWQISRNSIVEKELLTTPLSQILTNSIEYPVNLIYWIKNTQVKIIFDARQPLEIPDLYLLKYQPQSVFCLPIVKQDKVLGVLYLEHRHAPDIFTENSKTVISFLCTQAAIALENANLYQESQQAAENIRIKQRDLKTLLHDRQVMEIALRESEQRYHRIVSNVPGTIYQFEVTTDGTYRFNYLSARFAELFEIDPETVLADISVLLDRIVPTDRQSFDRSIQKAAKLGKAWNWLGKISTPSGQIKWIRSESRHQPTTDGSLAEPFPVRIVWDGILLDVTERQAALAEREQVEIALRRSEERYQSLSDNIPGVIYQFRIAPDGGISYPYVSSGSWELLQLSPAAMMADANSAIEMIHSEDLGEFSRVMAESVQNMTPKLWEGRAVLKSGEMKWIKSVSRPELQADGAIIWDGVMLDITDRQQAQLNLKLTNKRLELTVQELQQATRLKDEFLATMSHELRTPLNAILGMSEALQEEIFGSINPRQLNAISTIEQSGEHLLSLITDILDVSKISAGKLELQIANVSVIELCKSSLVLVKQQAIDQQIQLHTHLPVDLQLILVDERRMRQVLINLLNNAVKFTPSGGMVSLSVWVEDRPTLGNYLCFSITDTGIGIDQADLSKLFQPFSQIDSSLSRKYAGTGLGLVLVKQIVELHGGDVTITSEVGRGSCFTVKIPQPTIRCC